VALELAGPQLLKNNCLLLWLLLKNASLSKTENVWTIGSESWRMLLKTLELSTAQHFVFWKPTISRTNLFCACSELCTSWAWLKWMRSKGRELELACLVQHQAITRQHVTEEKQHVLGQNCSLSAMPIFVFGTGSALLENSNLPQLRLCQTDSTRSRPLD